MSGETKPIPSNSSEDNPATTTNGPGGDKFNLGKAINNYSPDVKDEEKVEVIESAKKRIYKRLGEPLRVPRRKPRTTR